MHLNWVTFNVRDLDKSVEFYTEHLGIPVASRIEAAGHSIAMVGDEDSAKIELLCDGSGNAPKVNDSVSVGIEIQNLDQLVASLRGKGFIVKGPISPGPHIRFFFVQDPDGYAIQLVEQH